MSSLFKSIPDTWQRTTLRHLAQGPKNGAWGSDVGEGEIDAVCVRVADFDWSRLTLKLDDPTTRSFKKQQFKNLQLRPGDIVIEKSGGGEKTPVGRVVSFDENVEAVTSNFVARIRPHKGVWSRFFLYLLAAHYMSGYSHQFIKQNTGIQNLDDTNLFRSDVWVPELATQRQIADFLDRETARIDQLIEKKRRLVALLGEEKDARTTQEVVGNTRQHTERKASRNAFISSIPAHWNDAQLKHVVRPGTAITYGIVQAGPEYEGGIPYIRTGDMKGDALPLSGYPLTSPEIAKSYSRSALEKGDLVMAIRATVGKCLRVPDKLIGANLTQGTAKISPGPKVRRDYLFFALQSKPAQSFFDESAKGATFKEITLDRLRRLVIPLPSLLEQDGIVERLKRLERRQSKASATINASIDRLKEYRSALITAAVTGQIDLRTYAKSGKTNRQLDALQEEMGA